LGITPLKWKRNPLHIPFEERGLPTDERPPRRDDLVDDEGPLNHTPDNLTLLAPHWRPASRVLGSRP